jgi:hypothetical protein
MLKRALSLSVAADEMALPKDAPRAYWHVLADMAYVTTATDDASLAYVMLERRRVATERALATAHLAFDRRGDAETYTTSAPSPFVATVSERKVKRGKKGTTTTITARGRSWVAGDSQALDDQTTRSGRVPRVVISHAIDALRDGARFGHVNGDQLAALTTRLYDVPALIGSDQWSWSEATPEIPSSGAAVLAAQTCGLSGGTVPMLDLALAPEYRCADADPRWFPTAWPRKPHLRRHAARLRLPVPRARQSDPVPRETVRRGVWTWEHHAELVAPAADPAYMWHGHRVVKRGETVRKNGNAAATYRDAFVISHNLDLRDALASLASVVADDGKGKYRWSVEGTDIAGTLTVDGRGRVSVIGAGIEIRQASTLDAVRKQLARV